MCLIKRSICGRAAQRDREGEEGSRRRGGKGAGRTQSAGCRRHSHFSKKKAQKGEVVLNFICVVTLCHCPPSLSLSASLCHPCHAHSLAHHYLRVCKGAGEGGQREGQVKRVKRTLKPEIGSYSSLALCLPLSALLPSSPRSSCTFTLSSSCSPSSLLPLLLRHLLMSTCYCST